MKLDREMAVEAMRNMGWTAERRTDRHHPYWRFMRPDTGGLLDVLTKPQADLGMAWVADMAMQYGDAPDLCAEIVSAKGRWLQSRFVGIFTANAPSGGAVAPDQWGT